jgi:hypothetical protein
MIALLMAIVAIVVWKIATYYLSMKAVKKKVDNLPCDSHTEQLREIGASNHSIASSIDTLNDTISSTNDIVIEMSKWISKKDTKMVDVLIRKNSPYVITGVGYKLLKDSGGEKVVDNNLEFFFNEVDKMNPKTPYEVEDQSINSMIKNIGNVIFNPIKQFVYYSPEEIKIVDPDTQKDVTIGISTPSILNIMGIYLRDKYMEKHPEIEQLPEYVNI